MSGEVARGPCRFAVGQAVFAPRYDKDLPPSRRWGLVWVVACEEGHCESGWMITLRAKDGRMITLDQNWVAFPE